MADRGKQRRTHPVCLRERLGGRGSRGQALLLQRNSGVDREDGEQPLVLGVRQSPADGKREPLSGGGAGVA